MKDSCCHCDGLHKVLHTGNSIQSKASFHAMKRHSASGAEQLSSSCSFAVGKTGKCFSPMSLIAFGHKGIYNVRVIHAKLWADVSVHLQTVTDSELDKDSTWIEASSHFTQQQLFTPPTGCLGWHYFFRVSC